MAGSNPTVQVAVGAALAQLLQNHGEDRILDLIHKGIKYERGRARQRESAKARRELYRKALLYAMQHGYGKVLDEEFEAGESAE